MPDLDQLLPIALVVLTLATAAGFGLQRGRLSQQEKRIETLQGQLKESDDELARKDRRQAEAERALEKHKTESSAEIQRLKTDLAALARVVTGEAHWTAIGEKLDVHHQEAEAHWAKAEGLAGDILEVLHELAPPKTG